jgi:uncharacterized membrane protein
MLLATLGAVFAKTGVGDGRRADRLGRNPDASRDACVLAYGLGMALFTIIMGNAFAAFPVMTAGVGLPLLIGEHHAHAAVVGALGMLCGYCGTLLTPMAANFNIVPVALLELRDPNAVIRAQWPTAVVLFTANLLLLGLARLPMKATPHTVLLTGFEPFGGEPENPSLAIARALDRKRVAGHRIDRRCAADRVRALAAGA